MAAAVGGGVSAASGDADAGAALEVPAETAGGRCGRSGTTTPAESDDDDDDAEPNVEAEAVDVFMFDAPAGLVPLLRSEFIVPAAPD